MQENLDFKENVASIRLFPSQLRAAVGNLAQDALKYSYRKEVGRLPKS